MKAHMCVSVSASEKGANVNGHTTFMNATACSSALYMHLIFTLILCLTTTISKLSV